MEKVRRTRFSRLAPLAAALLAAGASLALASCFDDECDPECRVGYSCYYGICLSRGYCSLDDRNIERDALGSPVPHCVARDEAGVCTDYRGLCREGYSCECTYVSGDNRCSRRECRDVTTLEGDYYPTD